MAKGATRSHPPPSVPPRWGGKKNSRSVLNVLPVTEFAPAKVNLALHVLEVMEAFELASKSGEIVRIKTRVERPAPLSESIKRGKIS